MMRATCHWCPLEVGGDDAEVVGEALSEHYQAEHPLDLELVYLAQAVGPAW